MGLTGFVWLGYQFWRLLSQSAPVWPSSPVGAADLRLRYSEVHAWFTGNPVYGQLKAAIYPPASYVMLWPLLGWSGITSARWLWAATTVAALVWLVSLMVRESGADTPLERIYVALMPLSMYATGATIGNGQLIVHLLPMLVCGILLLSRSRGTWREDLWAAGLLLFAMVKPTVAAPFFWIALFVPGRVRPALLVALGYVALTLVAVSFQHPGMPALLHSWAMRALHVSAAMSQSWTRINLESWLTALGLEALILPLSLLVLAALGWWTYRYRRRDPWLLLGVTALVARLWTYHGWYDDLLILLPMITLFRIAKRGPCPDGGDIVAGTLLALTTVTVVAPGGLYLLPSPWKSVYVACQTIVWIAVLVFLVERCRHPSPGRVGLIPPGKGIASGRPGHCTSPSA
jgi:hypothetical protein